MKTRHVRPSRERFIHIEKHNDCPLVIVVSPEFITLSKRREQRDTERRVTLHCKKSCIGNRRIIRDVVEGAIKIRASMIEKFPKLTNFDAMIIRGNARINTLTAAGSRVDQRPAPGRRGDTPVGLAGSDRFDIHIKARRDSAF